MTLKERAQSLKRDIPAVFLALKDKDTPISAKVLAGITVCYALSPRRSDTRFYSGSRVPGRSDPIARADRVDREIDSGRGLGAKPRAVGAFVGEWEAEKMVLCNPNLPDLADDSVAGRSGRLRENAAGPFPSLNMPDLWPRCHLPDTSRSHAP